MRKAAEIVIAQLELAGLGKRKVNYKMRDAAFSRQRYWGEPIPVKWINGVAYPLDESELPLELPHVESYKPGPDGEGPLANIKEWTDQHLETNTMPGYAGSSWYFLRYMDPHNDKAFCDRKASDYWGQVDIYIGGTEHAVGHLLYSRMWTKALLDLGYIGHDEPYKRLVNQGMIQGSSRFAYRKIFAGIETPLFISFNRQNDVAAIKKWYHEKKNKIISDQAESTPISSDNSYSNKNLKLEDSIQLSDEVVVQLSSQLHVDVNIVDGVELDIDAFKRWRGGE